MPSKAVKRVAISNPTSHATTIGSTDDVMDGRPFLMMWDRPVPNNAAGLKLIVSQGVDRLKPRMMDGYSAAELAKSDRFGLLNNTIEESSNVRLEYQELNRLGLRQMPWIQATKDIAEGEQIRWNSGNKDTLKAEAAKAAQHAAKLKAYAAFKRHLAASALPSAKRQAMQGAQLALRDESRSVKLR